MDLLKFAECICPSSFRVVFTYGKVVVLRQKTCFVFRHKPFDRRHILVQKQCMSGTEVPDMSGLETQCMSWVVYKSMTSLVLSHSAYAVMRPLSLSETLELLVCSGLCVLLLSVRDALLFV